MEYESSSRYLKVPAMIVIIFHILTQALTKKVFRGKFIISSLFLAENSNLTFSFGSSGKYSESERS
jgi:hypothetical protein